MGRIFWNFIARVAFIIGFVTAAAGHATPVKHEAPKAIKPSGTGPAKSEQRYKYCMPDSIGVTCQNATGAIAILECTEAITHVYNDVVRNGEGKMVDGKGEVLPCFVSTDNTSEINMATVVTRTKRKP